MHTLTISLRSPFARRIRVLLEELKLETSLEVVDVFKPTAALREKNPLARVPVLTTETGEQIVDSHEIQTYLRMKHGYHPIFQTGNSGMSLARSLSLSGLAAGVMELTVSYFLESLRPLGQRSVEDQIELRENILRAVRGLERELGEREFFTGAFSVIDIDVVCALTYAKKRVSDAVLDGLPKLQGLVERLERRPSFTSSFPPA